MIRLAPVALLACSIAPAPSPVDDDAPAGEARGGLVLTVDGAIYWGETTTWTVSGATPGESVYFVYSIDGELDDGFCPGPMGPTCLDLAPPARLFGSGAAGPDGTSSADFAFPGLELLGRSFTVQGAIPRGPGGADSVVTDVMALPIHSRLSAPVAEDDGYVTAEDAELVVADPGLLANDSDADGDVLTIAIVERPTEGLLAVEPGGGFTYTPRPDFHGVDTFTYQLFDGIYASEEAVVALTVTSVNDVPFGFPDGYEATEDVTLEVSPGVLANDLDVEGDFLTATLVSPPDNGSLVLRADGTFDYTPDRDFTGEDTFTYRPTDADLGDEVTVTLYVMPVNDAPVAIGETYGTDEDVPLEVSAEDGLLANDSDVDGDRLEAVVDAFPTNGELTVGRDGSFGYLPDPGWSGVDSFTYHASDGALSSGRATVTVSVGDVNDPPFAVPDRYEGVEDGVVVVDAPTGLLANDIDLDGDPLVVSLSPMVDVTNGVLSLSSDGSFTYTPDADFWGEDTFTYEVSDGLAAATAEVTLGIAPVNDIPIAGDDAYATPFGVPLVVDADDGVLANDSDRDGELEPRPGEVAPIGGTLVLNPDGSLTYTPHLCFTGLDTFTYVAFDGADASPEATVTIDVGPPSDEDDAFCNAYGPVTPRVPYTDFEFEDYAVRTLIPPAPIGLMYGFHGSGGNVANASGIEYTELYNLLYDAGVGVVLTDSTTRLPEAAWDVSSVDAVRNDDWARLARLRDHLVGTTDVEPSTPILSFGFSNGGSYSAVFAEIAQDEGWPIAAFSVHNSAPFGAPDLPAWWTTSVNDDKGTPGLVRSAHLAHAASGAPSEYRLSEEFPVHPMYFRKVPLISHEESQAVFDDMVAFGLLDADGNRVPAVGEIDSALRAWTRETAILGPDRFSARLRPAWGDHRVSAVFKDEEAAFLTDAL